MDFPIFIELANNLNKIVRISITLSLKATEDLYHKPVRVFIAGGGTYITIKLVEMLKSQNILILVKTKWVYLPI